MAQVGANLAGDCPGEELSMGKSNLFHQPFPGIFISRNLFNAVEKVKPSKLCVLLSGTQEPGCT